MKITAEKDQQSQCIVRIEIEPAELEEAKGKAARKLSNRVRIPGFRPGKAPRALVERFVGQEMLLEEATRDLLPKAYESALKEADLKPIAQPDYRVESTDPLTIIATIPLEPTVELGEYKEIRFDLEEVDISEDEVEKVILNLLEQQAVWEEPEEARPAQDGDQVDIELQTLRDGELIGEPFPRTGVLGKGELLSQIDEQIVGMSVGEEKVVEVNRKKAASEEEKTEAETAEVEGEKPVTLEAEPVSDLPEVETIPLDEEESLENGAPMTFQAKLNAIKLKRLPELDDEFAKGVTDVQTVDELRERVRKNLVSQREGKVKNDLTEKFVEEAVNRSVVQMPPVLVEAEAHSLEENLANRLKQQKLTLEQYLKFSGKSHEDLHAELHPQAEDRLKKALVLRELARAENITIERGEVDREVEKMVDEMTLNVADDQKETQARSLRGYFAQETTRDQISENLFSRKLSERLIEIATDGKVKPTSQAEAPVVEAEATPVTDEAETEAKPKKAKKAKAEAAVAEETEAAE